MSRSTSGQLWEQGWSRAERVMVREFAAFAGHEAYKGERLANNAVHQKAAAWMYTSKLLAPHLSNRALVRLLMYGFLDGWREAEEEHSQNLV
jgi:hypothetical protein